MRLSKGFSLIEMLVTVTIVSIGMLALGSFYMASVNAESAAQQRLTAVHMAEQIIEDWQNTNILPTPNCKIAGVAAVQLVLSTPAAPASIVNCVPNDGIPLPFTIVVEEIPAQAPIPNAHLLYPGVAGGQPVMGELLTIPNSVNSPHVKVRKVTLSWSEKAQIKSIFLTHITRR
jgi:prepilin-type N-terminal cleavage/methylation domain-containing protein